MEILNSQLFNVIMGALLGFILSFLPSQIKEYINRRNNRFIFEEEVFLICEEKMERKEV